MIRLSVPIQRNHRRPATAPDEITTFEDKVPTFGYIRGLGVNNPQINFVERL